jgi:RNA polymerase sigma factor (sigma-70 family)
LTQGEWDAGSAQAFLRAYEDHVGDVYGFFAVRAGSRRDAEDLTQLTFERAWRAWARYDEQRASVQTWLLVIARNAYVDHRRRDRTQYELELHEEEVAESGQAVQQDPQTRLGPTPELAAAVGRLREREREVLALRFGGDLQTAEIAEMLGISVANAQQILSRAVRKLRRELGPESGHGPASVQIPRSSPSIDD